MERAGGALLFVLGALACLRIYPHVQALLGRDGLRYAWDFQAVCTALDALRSGLDPYRAYLSAHGLPVTYPVLHIYILAPLCALSGEPVVYVMVIAGIALASGVALWRLVPATPWDRIAVLVAIFAGFKAFDWELTTGNVAILELPLAAATVRLLAARKYAWSGLAFGLMASVKILPLVGAAALLLIPESAAARARSFSSALAGFLAVHILNAVLFARWLPSYFAMLTWKATGGTAEDTGGVLNQDTIHCIVDGLGRLGFNQPMAGFAIACLGLAMGALIALACRPGTPTREPLPPVAAVSLIVLALWLFLFRQKNYAFEAFVPFTVAAGYGVGLWTGRLAILASIVVTAAFFTHAIPVRFLDDYHQLMGAWSAFLVLLTGAVFGSRPAARGGTVAAAQDGLPADG